MIKEKIILSYWNYTVREYIFQRIARR